MPAHLAVSLRVLAAGLLALAVGMIGPIGDATSARANGSSSRSGSSMPPGNVRGDLIALRLIASRALKQASNGELASARRDTLALKRGWDAAEASVQARVGMTRWRRTDRSLDDALEALQARQPSPGAAWLALSDLLLALYALESVD